MGIEVNDGSVGGGEVVDALAVGVGHRTVAGGAPSVEGVGRAGEGIGGEVLCLVVGEGLVGRDILAVVAMEADGVGGPEEGVVLGDSASEAATARGGDGGCARAAGIRP